MRLWAEKPDLEKLMLTTDLAIAISVVRLSCCIGCPVLREA
jgi:hypothetical protein